MLVAQPYSVTAADGCRNSSAKFYGSAPALTLISAHGYTPSFAAAHAHRYPQSWRQPAKHVWSS